MLTADTVYYYRILLPNIYMQAHFLFLFIYYFCHAHIISRLEEEGSRGKGRRVVRGGEGRKEEEEEEKEGNGLKKRRKKKILTLYVSLELQW